MSPFSFFGYFFFSFLFNFERRTWKLHSHTVHYATPIERGRERERTIKIGWRQTKCSEKITNRIRIYQCFIGNWNVTMPHKFIIFSSCGFATSRHVQHLFIQLLHMRTISQCTCLVCVCVIFSFVGCHVLLFTVSELLWTWAHTRAPTNTHAALLISPHVTTNE